MKTINWKDGVAQGLPEGVGATISEHDLSSSSQNYSALVCNHRTGEEWQSAFFPTRDRAERAAEAAMWRLGILPLPAWQKNSKFWEIRFGQSTMQEGLQFRIQIAERLKMHKITWVYSGAGVSLGSSGATNNFDSFDSLAAAQATAEAILRSLIALAVESKTGEP